MREMGDATSESLNADELTVIQLGVLGLIGRLASGSALTLAYPP